MAAEHPTSPARAVPVLFVPAAAQPPDEDLALPAWVGGEIPSPFSDIGLWRAVAALWGLDPDARGAPRSASREQARGLHVLMVEDNEVNQLVLGEMLAGLGCCTCRRRQRQEALERLAEAPSTSC